MKSITHTTSIGQAGDLFHNAISNSVLNLSNPKSIKDELQYLKEFLSKLKFQYLEQETRDKFLRLLLIGEGDSVTQEELDTLTEENLDAKLQLKNLKTQLHSLIKESTDEAEEVIALQRAFESSRADLDTDILEAQDLQSELDSILGAAENENYKALFNLNKMIDSDDLSLEEAIKIAQNAFDKDVTALAILEDDESKAEAALQARKQVLSELLERLLEMKIDVEKSNLESSQKNEPEQVYAQWIRGLNGLLRKFINTEVQVSIHGDFHTLSLNGQSIVLDEELNIVDYENSSLSKRAVEFINSASGDRKFWRLLRLLSTVVLQ